MLGYGVNAYFEIISNLTILFVVISMFSIPLMYIYSTGNRYNGFDLQPILQFFSGNIGGSTVFCKNQRLGFGQIDA